MSDWAVALALISISILVTAILLGLCRLLGGWTWLRAWFTGNREETASLTKGGQYSANGYMMNSESDIALDLSGNYRHYDNVANDMKFIQEEKFTIEALPTKEQIQPKEPENGYSAPNSDLPDALLFDTTSTSPLQRALSCDSVCSDTSVVLETLEVPRSNGELEIGLEYDNETEDLMVLVNQARDLVGTEPNVPVDSYVRVFLLPDKSTNMQTRIQKRTNEPIFKERFLFGVDRKELPQRIVTCYVYTCDKYTNTLIGEAVVNLLEVDLRKAFVDWIPILEPNKDSNGLGDLMFSLSYLPTAERLTVVVVKARNLRWNNDKESGDPFVKVYLMQNGKKICKKKTSVKKDERNPIFNESMIFSVPLNALQIADFVPLRRYTLQNVQLRLTVMEYHSDRKPSTIGHVFVGTQCTGKSLSHWNQMMSSLRKPIAMWHPLRKQHN
ncbi:synaptotagmin-12-like isoform X1 [Centruroides vittatus]|uniref:synaptotagmin-12-like isoform X1 n=1 Tax=Centruroides vittatus TaxID=120091 RepID=UPI0035103195